MKLFNFFVIICVVIGTACGQHSFPHNGIDSIIEHLAVVTPKLNSIVENYTHIFHRVLPSISNTVDRIIDLFKSMQNEKPALAPIASMCIGNFTEYQHDFECIVISTKLTVSDILSKVYRQNGQIDMQQVVPTLTEVISAAKTTFKQFEELFRRTNIKISPMMPTLLDSPLAQFAIQGPAWLINLENASKDAHERLVQHPAVSSATICDDATNLIALATTCDDIVSDLLYLFRGTNEALTDLFNEGIRVEKMLKLNGF